MKGFAVRFLRVLTLAITAGPCGCPPWFTPASSSMASTDHSRTRVGMPDPTRVRYRGSAAIAAAAVFTVLAVVGWAPAWARAPAPPIDQRAHAR